MPDRLEEELEGLVNRVAHELAHDITQIILRRLGIEGAAPRAATSRRAVSSSAVGRAIQRAAKGRSERAAPITKTTHKASRRARSASEGSRRGGAPQRKRATAEERAATLEKVARILEDGGGLSVGEIERRSGLSRACAIAALKSLKEQGRAFMGGTKRFARYASTQAIADRASQEARGGNGG